MIEKLNLKNLIGYLNLAIIELKEWFNVIISFCPGKIGKKLRSSFIPFKHKGFSTYVHEFCTFHHPQNIYLGSHTRVGRKTTMNGAAGITIKDHVVIGPEVLIWTQNHKYSDIELPIMYQGWDFAPVVIENDVFLGARVIVMPGVTIGRGTVIGAGSVVLRDIAPYSVAMGFPARKIGSRLNEKKTNNKNN